jgi:hypothetical protein
MRYDVVYDRSQSNSAGTTGHASPQTNRGWHEGQDKVPYTNQLATNLPVEVMHMPEYKGIKNNVAGQSLSSPLHACPEATSCFWRLALLACVDERCFSMFVKELYV